MRATIHLVGHERALLDGLAQRRDTAAAAFAAAQHDFETAGVAMASTRGIKAALIDTLTVDGLVILMPSDVSSPPKDR